MKVAVHTLVIYINILVIRLFIFLMIGDLGQEKSGDLAQVKCLVDGTWNTPLNIQPCCVHIALYVPPP